MIVIYFDLQQAPETCFAVFLPALVMGNFLVLNLFLALLLNSFSCEELKSRKQVRLFPRFLFLFYSLIYHSIVNQSS